MDGWPEFEGAEKVGRDRYGIYADVVIPDSETRFRMRWIESGTFLMGSPGDEEARSGNEGPQHEVTLTQGFWLADAPCTQRVYEAITGENPSKPNGTKYPVTHVSWDEAQAFLQALTKRFPGTPFTLPTEAQWEYTCRAGTAEARYGNIDAIAWYRDNANKQIRAVRQKHPNAWGLYDMLGNVWEWCLDEASGLSTLSAYLGVSRVDPIAHGNNALSSRVVRGGSWRFEAQYARAAYRLAFPSERRLADVGFRLARGRA